MTTSMHAYGNMRPPGSVIDRVPSARPSVERNAASPAVCWAPPVASTRVELAPPGRWAAPNAALLLSITIAPLRLTPVIWAAPTVVVSPWPAPMTPVAGADDIAGATMQSHDVPGAAMQPSRRVWRRHRIALVAATALVVATVGAVAAIVVNV